MRAAQEIKISILALYTKKDEKEKAAALNASAAASDQT
jgi:hypothetical protein